VGVPERLNGMGLGPIGLVSTQVRIGEAHCFTTKSLPPTFFKMIYNGETITLVNGKNREIERYMYRWLSESMNGEGVRITVQDFLKAKNIYQEEGVRLERQPFFNRRVPPKLEERCLDETYHFNNSFVISLVKYLEAETEGYSITVVAHSLELARNTGYRLGLSSEERI